MKLLASFAIAIIALGGGLWGLSTIYDSDVVRDGAFYHEPKPADPPVPIHASTLGDKSCAEVEVNIFAAAEALTTCSDASQCRLVSVANLDHIRAINKSNWDKFSALAEQHATYCGRILYSSAQKAQGDNWKEKLVCSRQKCGVEYTLVETWEEQLYRESLETIESDTDTEAL